MSSRRSEGASCCRNVSYERFCTSMRFGISTIDGILPKSVRLRRPHWITAAIYIRLLRTTAPTVLAITSSRRWVLVSASVRAAAGRRNPPGGELLHLNLRALLLELLPHVF